MTAGHLPCHRLRNRAMLKQYENPYVTGSRKDDRHGAVALFVGDEAHHLWPEAVQADRTLIYATGVTQ